MNGVYREGVDEVCHSRKPVVSVQEQAETVNAWESGRGNTPYADQGRS